MDENYLYAFQPSNQMLQPNILIAVENENPTNVLIFSQDLGNSWNKYHFSNELVIVNKIIEHQMSSTFYLVCTNSNNLKSIYKVEFSIDTTPPTFSTTSSVLEIKNADLKTEYKKIDFLDNDDEKILFHLENPKNIQENSFEIKFQSEILDLPVSSLVQINNYLIRVVSFKNNKSYLPFETANYKIIDHEPNDPKTILDRFKATDFLTSEQILKTTENELTVSNLEEGVEYICYFYANITRKHIDETATTSSIVLLNKKLVILTKDWSILNEHNKLIALKVLAFIIPLSVFACSLFTAIWIWLNYKKKLYFYFESYYEKFQEKSNNAADAVKKKFYYLTIENSFIKHDDYKEHLVKKNEPLFETNDEDQNLV